jgi:multidrug efflux pump
MSVSAPFIQRPVATLLLMAAILLAGFVGYRQLPVSALPQVDYPTIQVVTFYRAGPDVMASSVTAPLERQFGQVAGLNQMTSTSSSGSLDHHASIHAGSEYRRRGAGGSGRNQCRLKLSAGGSSESSDLQQDQPSRCTHPDACSDLPTLPLSEVQDLAETRLAQKISQLRASVWCESAEVKNLPSAFRQIPWRSRATT